MYRNPTCFDTCSYCSRVACIVIQTHDYWSRSVTGEKVGRITRVLPRMDFRASLLVSRLMCTFFPTCFHFLSLFLTRFYSGGRVDWHDVCPPFVTLHHWLISSQKSLLLRIVVGPPRTNMPMDLSRRSVSPHPHRCHPSYSPENTHRFTIPRQLWALGEYSEKGWYGKFREGNFGMDRAWGIHRFGFRVCHWSLVTWYRSGEEGE